MDLILYQFAVSSNPGKKINFEKTKFVINLEDLV